MREVLLVRFGEVHLKGLNRPYFLKMLVEDIKKVFKERLLVINHHRIKYPTITK